MYMSETIFNDAARSLASGLSGNTILMIAECDLLSECLVEVLSRKFPEWDVHLHGGNDAGSEEEESSARLIILYRIAPSVLPGIIRRIRQAKVNARIKAAIRRHHVALHRQQAEERFQPLRQLSLLCGVLHGVDVRTQAERNAFAQRRGQQEHRRQCRRCQPPHQPHSNASAGTICFFRLTTFGSHTW